MSTMSQEHAITITKREKRIKLIKSKTDRISELPDDILFSIGSYFSVRDAANASVLSRRWRYLCLCAYMSHLNFDLTSMFLPHEDDCNWRKDNARACRQYKDIFVRGVNQFLQSYKASRLTRFSVTFCLEEDSADHINQWVIFAASMGVEDLSLNFSCMACIINSSCEYINFYTLRSELLSQGNVSKVLKLQLRECILGPGVINQFSSLTSLSLARVKLGAHEVESILSCCFNVESMSFATCTLIPVLCIPASLRRLKYLCVTRCLEVEEIELSATNLSCFEVDADDSIKVSFSRVPNLKQIFSRAIDETGMQYVFSQLAKDLPLVETLSVYTKCNWVQCLPEQITTFNKVKKLEIYAPRYVKLDLSKLTAILKACPIMEKFLLVYSVFSEEEIPKLTMPLECLHKYLKEVHIGGFHFRASYVEFALYMLEYCVALERLVVDPELTFYYGVHANWSGKRITWNKGERAKVCSRLQDHPKSSVIIIR